MPPPIPASSNASALLPAPRRRPVGAVATVMASGLTSVEQIVSEQDGDGADVSEQQSHGNPYDLQAAPGSTVTASYPFTGEESLQQLSFAVGDIIVVKQKEAMWSWGLLERGGNEGWFPHNYVGTTFKPLPGIHELAAKLQKRREEQDVGQASDDTAVYKIPYQDTPGVGAALHSGSTAVKDTSFSATAGGLAGGVFQGVDSDTVVVSGLDDGVHTGDPHVTRLPVVPAVPAARTTGSPKFSTATNAKTKIDPQTTSAPSLPPFSKDGATFTGTTPAAVQTHQPAERIAAEVVDGTQIDGVGFAGTPANAAPCKCCIM